MRPCWTDRDSCQPHLYSDRVHLKEFLRPRNPSKFPYNRPPRLVCFLVLYSSLSLKKTAFLLVFLTFIHHCMLRMNFLALPVEVRAYIYDFCFPPKQSRIQLIPYHASSPTCRLNAPLSLYLVCRLIYAELPPLSSKLRSLDLLYIIQGAFIRRLWRSEDWPRKDDDSDLSLFRTILRIAERVRLVGAGRPEPDAWLLSSASRKLSAGLKCALRVLEIQPILWPKWLVVSTVRSCLGLLATHPDVADRLEVRLIRDDENEGSNEELDAIEDWLRRYEELRTGDVSRRYSPSRRSFDGKG